MDLVLSTPLPPASALRAAIRADSRTGETEAVRHILAAAVIPPDTIPLHVVVCVVETAAR